MSYSRTSQSFLVAAVALVLTGPSAPKPVDPPKADEAAAKILDDGYEKLKSIKDVQATFWQQIEVQGLIFQSEGSYQSGPNNRLKLDLKVYVGKISGELETVSDGKILWDATRIGTGERAVRKIELKSYIPALNSPSLLPQAREEFFPFEGLAALLNALKQKMVVTHAKATTWNGIQVNVLTATWPVETIKKVTHDGKAHWPPLVPRQCLVTLDATTGFPYRFDWRSAAPPQEGQSICQMEFRDPQLDKRSPEEFAKIFRFDPGNAKVTDGTEEIIKRLNERAQALMKK